jgi:gluconate 2-dehydrogenase alpha chain
VTREVDAIVVGLGWTGSIIAKELADAGLSVLAFERGPDRRTRFGGRSDARVDELDGSVHRKFVQSLADETFTVRHTTAATAVPYRQIGSFKPGFGVGGAGLHWSGTHFRALPEDLRLASNLTERFGKGFVPDRMELRDYPVSFAELESSFDFFEKVCGTTGVAGVIGGTRQAGGNPFEGSRSDRFPLPPNPLYASAELFESAAARAGYHPFPVPASNASQRYTNPYGCTMSPCQASGMCSDYVCHNDAKASPNLNILAALAGQDNFAYRANAQVLKVNLDSSGTRATGVTFLDRSGAEQVQRAAMVFLCASTLYNVHLMLLSQIGKAYDPVSRAGVVGRNYTYQNVSKVDLFFDRNVHANPFIGIGGAGVAIDDFNGNQLDNAKAGFIGGGIIAARQPGAGPVRGIPLPAGTPQWGEGWKQAVARHFRHTAYFEVQASCMPYADRYLDLDPTYTDAFGRPLLRITFDWDDNEIAASRYLTGIARDLAASLKPLALKSNEKAPGAHYDLTVYQTSHNNGGAIMGDSPETSALNRFLQSWDVPNVFAIGANAFPQTNAYNPTGLVGALAYWSARKVVEAYPKTGIELW